VHDQLPDLHLPGNQLHRVTIILTGPSASKIGTLTVTATPPSPRGPESNSASSAFNGVLFYMDYNASDSNGNGNAKVISRAAADRAVGGMYFSVTANWGGNSNTTSTCTEIVGKNLTFGGNSTMNVGCPTSVVSQVSVLKMLQ
jgi:hypothetical protein